MNQSIAPTITSTDKQSDKNPISIFIVALLVAAAGPFASDSYLPSLPSMAHIFGTTSSMMQLSITLYLLGFSLSQLFYGPLSDQHGRRKIILIGLAICIGGSFLCAVTPSASLLLLGRLIQGIGIGVTNSLFRAIMRDIYSGARMAKMNSYAGMSYSLAPAIAPIIGGYLQSAFGWRSNFIFLFLLISGLWLLVWKCLPETNKELNPHATKRKHIIENYRTLLTSKTFIGFTLCSSFAYSGLIAYLTISPFLFQTQLKLTPVQYSWLSLAITFGIMGGQYLNTFLVDRFDIKKIIMLGMAFMLSGGTILFIFILLGKMSILTILFPTFLFICGCGCVFPNAMAGALSPFAKMAGIAGALYGCIQIGISSAISMIIALLTDNQTVLAACFVLLGSAIFLTTKILLRQKIQ